MYEIIKEEETDLSVENEYNWGEKTTGGKGSDY